MQIKDFLKRLLPLPTKWAIMQNQQLMSKLDEIERNFEELKQHQEIMNAQAIKNHDFSKKRFAFFESMIEEIYDTTVENKKICPICLNEVRVFLPFEIDGKLRKNAHCPYCFCAERQRFLWCYLKEHTNYLSDERQEIIKILHFAPEKGLYDKFSVKSNINYYPVDINPLCKRITNVVDIQDMQYEDNTFDVIICNHVLEHVPNDYIAIKELIRVLKKGGEAYITAPVFGSLEKTIENNPMHNTPESRQQFYGQHDHLRKYGRDFPHRLRGTGFKVTTIKPNKIFTNDEMTLYCIKDTIYDYIYKCTTL
ncbi:MAG: methyltransferase domain-containing protein [Defluviitaleaceae bacterium]|nr:methyltransferase domain-containing protein [Defluviitaleaceae bacterium]